MSKLWAWVLVNGHILLMKDDPEAFASFLKLHGIRVTFYAPFRPWVSMEAT